MAMTETFAATAAQTIPVLALGSVIGVQRVGKTLSEFSRADSTNGHEAFLDLTAMALAYGLLSAPTCVRCNGSSAKSGRSGRECVPTAGPTGPASSLSSGSEPVPVR